MDMMPRTCANCEHAVLLTGNADAPVPSLCTWTPTWGSVEDARAHFCAQFEMAAQPRYTVPGQGAEVDDAAQELDAAE